MRPLDLSVVLYCLAGVVGGAPADDMESLSESCGNAATVLNASLNNTMAMVCIIVLDSDQTLNACPEHFGAHFDHYMGSRRIDVESGNQCTRSNSTIQR